MKLQVITALAIGVFSAAAANAHEVRTPQSVSDANPAGAVQTYRSSAPAGAQHARSSPASVDDATPWVFARHGHVDAHTGASRSEPAMSSIGTHANPATPVSVSEATPWLRS